MTVIVIGIVSILGGILANGQNIAFLVALAFAVAASANLPTILYSLYWKRFNTRGALWSMYGGLISCVTLIIFSPVVSGKPADPATGKSLSMITDPSIDFHWFPLDNPGIVSIPLAFFLGWLGSVTAKDDFQEKYAEMEVRSLTGAGSERAAGALIGAVVPHDPPPGRVLDVPAGRWSFHRRPGSLPRAAVG